MLDASPTVVAGRVYIGAQSGGFYALDESTGTVVWSRQLDTRPGVTCRALGITATAAVLPDPVTGTLTVYVSGARFLYALDAATGAMVWQTRIGPPSASVPDAYYNWSSPTVTGGHPTRPGLRVRQPADPRRGGGTDAAHRPGAAHLAFGAGRVGRRQRLVQRRGVGGRTGMWASTGNECDPTVDTCPAGNKTGHSLSIVHLTASLKFLQAWQVPGAAGHGHDWDFGSSPTLFASPGGSRPR